MISPRLAVLMTAITLIGTSAAPALATDYGNGGNGNSFSTKIERNNAIEQEQEACTNEAGASAGEDQQALFDADQTNTCYVNQDQGAAIFDLSDNTFDISSLIVS